MSKFLSKTHSSLKAYVPGELPKTNDAIKLNTNESPYPPAPAVFEAALAESKNLNLYSDPEVRSLTEKVAKFYGVDYDQVLMTNGSDEILNFAFMAFGDKDTPFTFPDITYGFYSIFANLHHIPYNEIPLKDDFTIDVKDFENLGTNIVIANPNAPSGLVLPLSDIERILITNPDNIVVIDEAYIDFGGETALPLINKYDNLLITRTFSKSYALAGARLGFGIGNKNLIADLNTIKFATNPYNVNRMTMAAGLAALDDADYYLNNCKKIIETRDYTKEELRKRGFTVTDSNTNFLFAKSDKISGEELNAKLKEEGVFVRHFTPERIRDFNRITVGTKEQMDIFLSKIDKILAEL